MLPGKRRYSTLKIGARLRVPVIALERMLAEAGQKDGGTK
jgi:hypothetical protein